MQENAKTTKYLHGGRLLPAGGVGPHQLAIEALTKWVRRNCRSKILDRPVQVLAGFTQHPSRGLEGEDVSLCALRSIAIAPDFFAVTQERTLIERDRLLQGFETCLLNKRVKLMDIYILLGDTESDRMGVCIQRIAAMAQRLFEVR
jgi:hypothetical protein